MNFKRYILILTLLCSSCFATTVYDMPEFGKNEIIFSSALRSVSAVDPTISSNSTGSNFPGARGPNQLIIYTPDYGDRTNTNEYGAEAVVQDNIVTVISGANSFIPKDGIVISGHGTAKNWLKENIMVGTKVHFDKNSKILNVYTTSDSFMYEAKEKINETNSMINYYKSHVKNYSYRNADGHINQAEKYLKKAKKDTDEQNLVKQYSEMALKEANEAMQTVLPSLPCELKGVWIRPTETTEAQIIATLNNIQKIGINNVFLETFYHGKTIYPSKVMQNYGFTVQNEQFSNIDALKIWICEAHKRNIKIHIWFQSFYVGNTPPSQNPKGILSVQPKWGNKTFYGYDNNGPTMSKSEHNGYFLDPANPEVQDFLTQLINEIITEYCPDGINLDYIRYPQAISSMNGWGYTKYARNEFRETYGEDPINIKPGQTHWKEWNEYRRENITNFVRKIGSLGREKKVYISTVIFPDVNSALNTKQQDWRTWSKRNYIDGFTPLFLTYDPDMVASMINDIKKVKAENTDLYAGIFVTFMGGSNEDLVRQIHETRKLNANGVILFDYAHTKGKYAQMLSQSAFETAKEQKTEQKTKKKKKFFKLFKKS